MDLDPEYVISIFQPTFAFPKYIVKPRFSDKQEEQPHSAVSESKPIPEVEQTFPALVSRIPAQHTTSVQDTDDGDKASSTHNSSSATKNRRWRIDGCDASPDGLRLYVVPLFISDVLPIWIDVVVLKPSAVPDQLRKKLDYDKAIHCTGTRVAELGIAKHVLQSLENWSEGFSRTEFERLWNNVPFASDWYFSNILADSRLMKPTLVKNHNLESKFSSIEQLRSLWHDKTQDKDWPRILDISKLRLRRRIYNTVSLVSISDDDETDKNAIIVMKSCLSEPNFLYHELKSLLTLPPHPNIITRPLHIVTKSCDFGVSNTNNIQAF